MNFTGEKKPKKNKIISFQKRAAIKMVNEAHLRTPLKLYGFNQKEERRVTSSDETPQNYAFPEKPVGNLTKIDISKVGGSNPFIVSQTE